MPFAKLENSRVHYQVTGNGDPLMLLMPQSSGPRGVDDFVRRLEPKAQLIRYDQRGTGLSDNAPASISMRSLADEVEAVLSEMDIQSTSLICHSTGCGIGTLLAATKPELVNKLVLITPWTHADQHLLGMQRLRQNAIGVLDPEQYSRFNSSILFPPQYRREHADGFAQMARTATPSSPDGFRSRLDAILAFDARKHYAGISAPTLVISADDDQLMPAWFGVEASNAINDSRYVELDSGGHMLPETRCEAVVDALTDFL